MVMIMNNAELRKRLSEAPKNYKGFVEAMMSLVKAYPEARDELVKFLDENKEVRAGTILTYITDKIEF